MPAAADCEGGKDAQCQRNIAVDAGATGNGNAVLANHGNTLREHTDGGKQRLLPCVLRDNNTVHHEGPIQQAAEQKAQPQVVTLTPETDGKNCVSADMQAMPAEILLSQAGKAPRGEAQNAEFPAGI